MLRAARHLANRRATPLPRVLLGASMRPKPADMSWVPALGSGLISVRSMSFSPKGSSAEVGGDELVAAASKTVLDDSGLVATMANLINDVHVLGDVPWWAAIVGTTLGLRLGLAVFNINSMATGARMRALQPYMHMSRKQVEAAQASGNTDAMIEASTQLRKLMKEHGVSPIRMLVAPVLNIPASLLFFWALQSLCRDSDKIEGFATGGTLWFEELGAPDPYAIIPACSVVFSLASIHLSASLQAPDQNFLGWSQDSVRTFMRGMAVVFGVISSTFPAGLTLSFASTSLVMLTTNVLIRTTPIQYLFNFPKGYPHDIKPILPPGLSDEEAERLVQEAKDAQKAQMSQNPLTKAISAPQDQQQSSSSSTSSSPSFMSWKGVQQPSPPPPPPSQSPATPQKANIPPPPPPQNNPENAPENSASDSTEESPGEETTSESRRRRSRKRR